MKKKNLIRVLEQPNRKPKYRICIPLAVRKDSNFVVGRHISFKPIGDRLYIEVNLYGHKIFYFNGKKTSAGIHIPREIAEMFRFVAGDLLEIEKINESKLLVKRSKKDD